MDAVNILSIISYQSLFFAFLVALRKYKNQPDWFLIAFFILTFLLIQTVIPIAINTEPDYVGYFFVPMLLATFFGPILYLHIITQLRPVRVADLKHLLPFALAGAMVFFFNGLMTPDQRIELLQNLKGKNPPVWFEACRLAIIFVIVPVYLIFSWIGLRQLKEINFSLLSYGHIGLEWSKRLLLCITFICLLFQGLTITRFISSSLFLKIQVYPFLILSLVVVYIGIYGIRNNVVFVELEEDIGESKQTPDHFTKVERKNDILTENQLQAYQKVLIQCMDKEKPYLNPKLSLRMLGKACNVPYYHLSIVLNQSLGTTFYDFVNEYRVNDFIGKLNNSDNHKFTLLSLAYESGFNSKSAFYSTFKKHKGFPPSEYLSLNKVN